MPYCPMKTLYPLSSSLSRPVTCLSHARMWSCTWPLLGSCAIMHDEDKLSSILFSIQASHMMKQTPYSLGVVRHLTSTREPVTPSPSAALGTLLPDEDFFIVFSIKPVTCCGWNRATCTWSGTWSPRGSQRLPLQKRGKDLPSILFSVQVNYMLKQTHTPWMWSWTDHYEVAVPYCPMKTNYPPSSSLHRLVHAEANTVQLRCGHGLTSTRELKPSH